MSGTTHTNAGTYNNDPWSFTGSANYNNQNGTVNDCIAKAHLTVTADNKSKAYNGSPFTAFTVTITGFVNGETVAVVSGSATYTGTAVGATLPGTYTITPTGYTQRDQLRLPAGSPPTGNFVNGTLTIGYGTCTGPNGPGGVILQPIDADGSSIFPRSWPHRSGEVHGVRC